MTALKLQQEALSNPVLVVFGSDVLPRYLVNSAILRSGKDPRACAEGAARMLSTGKFKNVEAKSCYCCGPEGRVAFIIEGPNQEAVQEALDQINIPVASIQEAEEVTPQQ